MQDSLAPDIPLKDKGLKRNAISFLSSIVIGVASTAPAYSLASALGPIAGAAALTTPAVMIVAFIPMLCIAVAYYYLNRADPDCGTTFSWVTLAMGPAAGWIGGWALIVTNIIVMPNLAVIAGQYSFLLFGDAAASATEVTLAGIAWIVIMTAICYLGIELSARTQQIMLGIELAVLLAFAGVALAKVYTLPAPPGSAHVALDWFNPFKIGDFNDFIKASLVAVFIYWGWDSGVAVNEETENPQTAPGYAAVLATFLLAAVYVLVAVAAIAFASPKTLSQNTDDVFASIGANVLGAWPAKLLILAVLTSSAASTQTTILPAARTALSMAAAGAIPKRFAEIDPRYLSPGFATLVMGAISIVWFAGLRSFSKNVLDDSIQALGLCIAFYYALTGFACTVIYRKELLQSAQNFLLMGVLPVAGGTILLFLFVQSCIALSSEGTETMLGIGLPLAMALGSLLLGILLMIASRWNSPDFFQGKAPKTGDRP